MLEKEGIKVVLLDKFVDTQFINTVEMNENGVSFRRVDSEVADALKAGDGEEIEAVSELFKTVVPEQTKIAFEKFKDESVPAVLNISEQSRRMEDMMKLYTASGERDSVSFPTEATLILNSDNVLIKKLASEEDADKNRKIAKHIYGLCLIGQRTLTAGELSEFLSESYDILGLL